VKRVGGEAILGMYVAYCKNLILCDIFTDFAKECTTRCHRCQQIGHMSADCPNKTSHRGDQRQATQAQPQKHQQRQQPNTKIYYCYNCGEQGHVGEVRFT